MAVWQDTCEIVVTVTDDQAPDITCPENVTDAITDPDSHVGTTGGAFAGVVLPVFGQVRSTPRVHV